MVDSVMASAIPPGGPDDTDQVLRNAAGGDSAAVETLLGRHRERLQPMIAFRLDDRVAARVDASDVVQEALTDAARKLADYVRDRPLPFYPWLHRLAAERLAAVHRRHRRSKARSVTREEADAFAWPDNSAQLMVSNLVAKDAAPSDALRREEQRRHMQSALQAAGVDRSRDPDHALPRRAEFSRKSPRSSPSARGPPKCGTCVLCVASAPSWPAMAPR